MRKPLETISYGLYLLTAKEGERDNGCIINTLSQLSSSPVRIQITVSKQNLTHDMILRTGIFNVTVLSEKAPFSLFERFGYASGRDTDKFSSTVGMKRAENGLIHAIGIACAYFSARVIRTVDVGTHTAFIAEVTASETLSDAAPMTYAYYFANVKPRPAASTAPAEGQDKPKGYVCKICGYLHEGDTLPDDLLCPICKHGAEDFEPYYG